MIPRVGSEEQIHGIVVVTEKGLLAQVLGLPPPALEKLIIIPKYVVSSEKTPWRRPGGFFRRIISEYGPQGLLKATMKTRNLIHLCYSVTFHSHLSCIDHREILLFSKPKEALINIIKRPKSEIEYDLVQLSYKLRQQGIPLEDIGITGSVALGFANSKVSDIDLVVYGHKSANKMLEIFEKKKAFHKNLKKNLGGLNVLPAINTNWRRNILYNIRFVSWIGVPRRIMGHCPKIVKEESPWRSCRIKVTIDTGQEGSLLYPPCAVSRDGTLVISFEYNIAKVLYTGGIFEIEGLCSKDRSIVYLATKEFPGKIIRLRNS